MNDNNKINAQSVLLRRTLDLVVAGSRPTARGPRLGWVLANDQGVVAEGSSTTALSEPQPVVLNQSSLYLSTNPFSSEQELTTFCATLRVDNFYLADASDSSMQPEALHVNRRFLTGHQQKRPHLLLKWAETADGFMAPSSSAPYWISNAHARRLVHQWRSQEAAIWVGKTTYLHDNPRLNVRFWRGPDPLRIVVDPSLQLPEELHIFDQSQPTLYYNNQREEVSPNLEFALVPGDYLSWPDRVRSVLNDLYARGIESVLVEGGATLLNFLLDQGWWDEARVFRAPTIFKEGLPAPRISDRYYSGQQRVSDNSLTTYRKKLETKQEVEE